ncbi:MAG TPA: DUF3142 domain-containing protein [Pyrinomonadaceae bacterium]
MRSFRPQLNFLLLTAVALALSLSLAAVLFVSKKQSRSLESQAYGGAGRMESFPRVILWAWERPERLGFIDPRRVGVAFLAKTLYLRGERVVTRPRLQPLEVPPGTKLVAVVRIESDRKEIPKLSAGQLTKAAEDVSELARLSQVYAVQIDFDARQTERDFYRRLLLELRPRLPDTTALSITALASWCLHDDWLRGLPVDEAVPMLFRMGVDSRNILSGLASGKGFRPTLCRGSSGVSTDEPSDWVPASRHVYVFNPESWSPASVSQTLERYKNEQDS